jgi:DivIVA domain-containing protein
MKSNGKTDGADPIEEIKDLRAKSGGEARPAEFKKSMFGGYDPKDVDDYIENIKLQHGSTLEAYQERFDEFVTFNEMLTKEKNDAAEKLASFTQDYEQMKQTFGELTSRNQGYLKEIASLKVSLAEYEEAQEKYGTDLKNLLELTHENALLKEEIHAMSQSRDQIAGENAMLKAQVESLTESVAKLKADNQDLQYKHNAVYSLIRQTDMSVGMKTVEYAQQQLYRIDKSVDLLGTVLSEFNGLKEETASLRKFINETLISKVDQS